MNQYLADQIAGVSVKLRPVEPDLAFEDLLLDGHWVRAVFEWKRSVEQF